jgi:hypothetical protein
MQQKRSTQKKRSKKPLIWIGAIVALGAIYAGGALHYSNSNTFMPNTSIAGVNVAGKTANQAQTLLNQHLKSQTLQLTDKNKVVKTVKLADVGITTVSKSSLQKAINQQSAAKWPLQLMHVAHADTASVTMTTNGKTGEAKLKAYAKKTAVALNKQNNPNAGQTVNINDVDTSNDNQDTVNAKLLASQIKTSAAKGAKTLDLKKTYQSTTSDADKIKQQISDITAEKAVYDINGTKVTIPASTIKGWLNITKNLDGTQTLSVDQTKITTYLNSLNDKYSTYGASVTFNSTKQGSQTVKSGIFGWTVATATDTPVLANNILAGKDFKQTATISGSGQSLKKGELGKTYVEVDKTNQHMWYYKDGKLVISTDVVTGKPSTGDATPTGVYFVWNKQRNATLKGKNDDGSNYASPVSYWMPIDYTGVGLHDAPWQPTFGGTWYKTHGSHGCVNTPPATMAKVYAAVALGTPVIVF